LRWSLAGGDDNTSGCHRASRRGHWEGGTASHISRVVVSATRRVFDVHRCSGRHRRIFHVHYEPCRAAASVRRTTALDLRSNDLPLMPVSEPASRPGHHGTAWPQAAAAVTDVRIAYSSASEADSVRILTIRRRLRSLL